MNAQDATGAAFLVLRQLKTNSGISKRTCSDAWYCGRATLLYVGRAEIPMRRIERQLGEIVAQIV